MDSTTLIHCSVTIDYLTIILNHTWEYLTPHTALSNFLGYVAEGSEEQNRGAVKRKRPEDPSSPTVPMPAAAAAAEERAAAAARPGKGSGRRKGAGRRKGIPSRVRPAAVEDESVTIEETTVAGVKPCTLFGGKNFLATIHILWYLA